MIGKGWNWKWIYYGDGKGSVEIFGQIGAGSMGNSIDMNFPFYEGTAWHFVVVGGV